MAIQQILGHVGRGQLPKPHCSWASLIGSLPVLSALLESAEEGEWP